jgi:hypothetical protein
VNTPTAIANNLANVNLSHQSLKAFLYKMLVKSQSLTYSCLLHQ